jgi:hypothetical protein
VRKQIFSATLSPHKHADSPGWEGGGGGNKHADSVWGGRRVVTNTQTVLGGGAASIQTVFEWGGGATNMQTVLGGKGGRLLNEVLKPQNIENSGQKTYFCNEIGQNFNFDRFSEFRFRRSKSKSKFRLISIISTINFVESRN